MKIIHCSDLHLDADLRSRFDAESAADRRAELMNTFRRLCRKAREIHAGAVLVCGDLFDTDFPSPSAVRAVEDLILIYSEILFFCLRGNHDSRSVLFRTREMPDNFRLFDHDWTEWELAPGSDGPCCEEPRFAAPRSAGSAGHEQGGVTSERCFTEQRFSEQRFSETYFTEPHFKEPRKICIIGKETDGRPFTLPTLDPANLNIVMLHGQAREGRSASDPETIPLGALRGIGIDYLALGHLHSFRSFPLDQRGTAAYSGCLEGRGFDECGECGYVLLDADLSSGRIGSRFIPFSARDLYRVQCDLSGCVSDAEVYERINDALLASPAQDKDLVRLELTGGLEYGCSPSLALVRAEWEDRYHYFDLVDHTAPVVRSEDFLCDPTLKGEFVRVVSAASDLEEAERAAILRCGLRALSGEPLFP